MPVYLKFWGKAHGPQDDEPGWHPLAYHNLDVAAVADVLLRRNPRKLAAMARLLDTPEDNARRLIVAMIALHDVGKFSREFQTKSKEAWESDGGIGETLGAWETLSGARHDFIGSQLRDVLALKQLFAPAVDVWETGTEFDLVWHAVSGHHGQPRVERTPNTNVMNNPVCREAARAFCRDVRALFDPLEAMPEPEAGNIAILSWAVAGLTVIADWIGSNRRGYFKYVRPGQNLAAYWEDAQRKAEDEVKKAGVLPAPVFVGAAAARLFPKIKDDLSPLQKEVLGLSLPDGPMLVIVEDVTGSGKTEAALLLAARLLAAGRADGLFFALPTMATANAMYARLGDAYLRLFADEARPSLVLAHGKRALHEGFQASILETEAAQPAGHGENRGDESSAVCAAWIADDRRKAFLAQVGVGTIDQALLGVLTSRYQSLRLWGLSDRVLIVDEAHAYQDGYTNKELETLLEFHAALGGSAIILSATLPSAQRRALAGAFARGLDEKKPKIAEVAEYPLLTVVAKDEVTVRQLGSKEDRKRALKVSRIATADDAAARIAEMAGRGAAVAWIRNTVDDAIEAVEMLRARELKPVLLHARFAMGDRLDIEKQITETLVPLDQPARRGVTLIGSQVLESSLNYDVDGMVTDLAPIDLMIQRAGRLWRHGDRTGRPIASPELLVLSPDPDTVTDSNWYKTLSKGAAAVYEDHGVVWRSAKTLFEAGRIVTPGEAGEPGGVRSLIEAVYAEDGAASVPEPLRRASDNAEGNRTAARSFANANLLKLNKGYAGDDNIWEDDRTIQTRLGELQTVFRLGVVENGRIVPLCRADDGDVTRSWALSEVSVAKYRADNVAVPSRERKALIDVAKADWPEWEREQPLLVLEPEREGWRGVVALGDAEKLVVYDRVMGLRFDAA